MSNQKILSEANVSIKATPDAMLQKASAVQNVSKRVREEFDEMARTVQRTNGYWNGEAADLYRRLFNGMKPQMAEMFERIEEHARDLIKIAQVYTGVETGITAQNTALPKDAIE